MPLDPGSPASWLRYARSDLALARKGADEEILLETVCFHTQQATEKALKAVLLHFNIPVPKTHSIERLISLLPSTVVRSPALIEAAGLSVYAVTFRYPSDEEAVSEQEYREAIKMSEAVVTWAETIITS